MPTGLSCLTLLEPTMRPDNAIRLADAEHIKLLRYKLCYAEHKLCSCPRRIHLAKRTAIAQLQTAALSSSRGQCPAWLECTDLP